MEIPVDRHIEAGVGPNWKVPDGSRGIAPRDGHRLTRNLLAPTLHCLRLVLFFFMSVVHRGEGSNRPSFTPLDDF